MWQSNFSVVFFWVIIFVLYYPAAFRCRIKLLKSKYKYSFWKLTEKVSKHVFCFSLEKNSQQEYNKKIVFSNVCSNNVCIVVEKIMDYGHPMKPLFIEIQNFWAWANKMGRKILGHLGYFRPNYQQPFWYKYLFRIEIWIWATKS